MLCEEGADVLLVARTGSGRSRRRVPAASEVRGARQILAADITDPDAAEGIVADATGRLGQLDVLVNNAGTARWRDLDDVPDETGTRLEELNVMAPMRLMRAAVPQVRERGWGRIVNVSSSRKRPSASCPEYSVAKAAEALAVPSVLRPLREDGVLVNAICPGPVKSELWMERGGLLDQSKEVGGRGS